MYLQHRHSLVCIRFAILESVCFGFDTNINLRIHGVLQDAILKLYRQSLNKSILHFDTISPTILNADTNYLSDAMVMRSVNNSCIDIQLLDPPLLCFLNQ